MTEYKELIQIWNQAETESLAAEAILNQVNDSNLLAAPHILRAWKFLALMCAKFRDESCVLERIDNFDALQWAISPSELLSIPEKRREKWAEYMQDLFKLDSGILINSSDTQKEESGSFNTLDLCDDLNDALRMSWKQLKFKFKKTLLHRLHLSGKQIALGLALIISLIYIILSLFSGLWNPLLWLKPRFGNMLILSASQDWGNLQIDKTVEGRPIVIAKVFYEKGIGTHAKSKIRILAPSGYERLLGACGIPEEVGDSGSIVCQIVSDDEILWESPSLQGDQAAQAFDVPIKGLTEFELRIDDAGDNINSDHANWVNLELK